MALSETCQKGPEIIHRQENLQKSPQKRKNYLETIKEMHNRIDTVIEPEKHYRSSKK